jgi:ligand-binding SRPBCC domain-containing protein
MARAYVRSRSHTLHQLKRTQLIEAPLTRTFDFFSSASNLEVITPKFLNFQMPSALPIVMKPGTQIEYALSLFRIPIQ